MHLLYRRFSFSWLAGQGRGGGGGLVVRFMGLERSIILCPYLRRSTVSFTVCLIQAYPIQGK